MQRSGAWLLAAGRRLHAWQQQPAGAAAVWLQQHHAAPPLQLQQQHPQLQQQPWWTARGMAVVVDVQRNNVDRAYAQLNKHFRASGVSDELRRREYRRSSAERKFAAARAAHNKRVGVLISERLKWVVRRRKLKM